MHFQVAVVDIMLRWRATHGQEETAPVSSERMVNLDNWPLICD
ncbi:MAG: hypothetical protein CG442_1291 [Methylococcaceae bacterium NSO1]|nr:MAG: hypothetical protein CG442_1291 [Methylococcaceae bacterium NSO1]